MVRRNVWLLSVTLVVVVGSFVLTLMSGNAPILGLDLQGGISVVLQPVGKYNTESLDVAKNIIDQRVNALGVGEPEISRQGSQIIVDLPGVKNRDKAKRIVGQTAELRFRPVLAAYDANPPAAKPATKPGAKTSTTGGTTGGTTGSSTTAVSTTAAPPSSTVAGGGGKARHRGTTTTAPATTAAAPTTTVAGGTTTAAGGTTTAGKPSTPKLTPRGQDKADQIVTLPDRDKRAIYILGPVPADLTGNQISSAQSALNPDTNEWVVNVNLKSAGAAAFDKLAAASYSKPYPQNAVAIVLDSVVQSAPRFNQAGGFNGRVQISGNFDQSSAGDLAAVLKYGALPVSLKQLTSESVSPTLGKDQLHAGIVAGLIGLALVALYMLVYYRILGLVVFVGIGISAMALYTLIVFLGQTISLTLTLAGVTGIIVSVGITVDSYVVYYEKLKDEVRTGKTVRSSLDRAFTKSFRTIVAADLVSLLGAAVLYFLAIGSVRGFALFLGISTVLDLVISYTFMHPLVSLLGRRPRFVNGWFGIARGLDLQEEPVLQGAQA
ncbi:MAG: protein translocase subunit SecD [Acidimicrobiia bacterium]